MKAIKHPLSSEVLILKNVSNGDVLLETTEGEQVKIAESSIFNWLYTEDYGILPEKEIIWVIYKN